MGSICDGICLSDDLLQPVHLALGELREGRMSALHFEEVTLVLKPKTKESIRQGFRPIDDIAHRSTRTVTVLEVEMWVQEMKFHPALF